MTAPPSVIVPEPPDDKDQEIERLMFELADMKQAYGASAQAAARDYYATRCDAAEVRLRTIRFLAESWLSAHPQPTGESAEAILAAIIGEVAATEAGGGR